MVDHSGRSDLHYAAADNDVERVRASLAAGLFVTAADKDGWTPLHFAAKHQALDAAALLIDAGAEVDARDKNGNSPLWRAVFTSAGRGELIALLRNAGANPLHANVHGVSPLSLARSMESCDVKQFFAELA